MTRVLVLGATGRTGSATLSALPTGVHAIAALRAATDVDRLPATRTTLSHLTVDLDDVASLRRAITGVDTIVNAIRLRVDIAETALVDLHERLLDASRGARPRIVTVGGAGALRLPDGTRFWRHSAFPVRTLPRGRAHAVLRDRLERSRVDTAWSYLIPPPDYRPDGPATGRYSTWWPSTDESAFTEQAISYADFGAAVAAAALDGENGTRLVAWPEARDLPTSGRP